MADAHPAALSGRHARRAVLVVCLLALSLAASVLVVPRAAALGQSMSGFAETGTTDTEQFQVMGANYAVRTNLTFGIAETIRVNVTSSTVDWAANAGGGGSRDLVVARFDGTPVATMGFTQAAGGPPSVYTASVSLGSLTLAPDWYYLHILIDDTVHTFVAVSPVRLAVPGVPHLIETYADARMSHPSDVFTPTSIVWVKVVALAGADTDQWDLAAYVDGASVVNGPNTNFDNFQRTGTTYTFSIDLSPFAANFAAGWAYSLNVRLAGGAFDAGKQIQIVSPTVAVTGTSLAPASARQGQTNVPVLEANLSLDPAWSTLLAPAAFNLDRVRVTLTGTGSNADIAGVHLYDDANGNGVVDAGDVLLASASAVTGVAFPVWLGSAGVTMDDVTSGGPLHLLVTYDVAPGATPGDTVGGEIAASADLVLEGTLGGITGLPVASGLILIGSSPILTVTNDPGIAPGSAIQGATGVTMDLLRFSTNGPAMVVSSLAVDLAGTGTVADVASVSLHVDNGNGAYNATQDLLLGSASGFTSGGVATFSGLNFAVDSSGRSVWVIYGLSSGATVGDRVGSSLPTNASVTATGGSVYGGDFPLDSGLVRVIGPTLTVDGRSLAPAQAIPGRINLPMLELTLSVDFGQTVVNGIRIDKRGTSTLDSDVPLAKIWLDNGDGIFDTGDLLLGSQAFVGGTTVIGGLALTVRVSQPRTLFVTYDLSPTATVGVSVSARLATPAYVSVDASSTVSPDTFPIASAAVLIAAPGTGAFLTVGSADMARWWPTVYEGQTGIPMEKLFLSVDQNSATVTGMRVNKIGTSVLDSDVAALKLYVDADASGNFSAGDQLLASTTFVGGIAVFGTLNIVVPFNQPVMLFLVIDISPSAAVGKTVAVYLGNHVNVVANATTTVDPNSFPIASSAVTVAAGSIHGTVRSTGGSPIANATVFLVQLNLTVTTDANGNYTFARVPLGEWTILVHVPGYGSGNRSANVTVASPNEGLDFSLAPLPNPGASVPLLIGIVGAGLLAVLLLGLLLVFVVRRRSRCPVCDKPKARDQEVCPECQAKGLRPGGGAPASPAPPGSAPGPAPAAPAPPAPERPDDEL